MDEFMNAALDEARAGVAEGGIPTGAALADGNRLMATGRNRRLQDSASIMHAEINCLYNANRKGVQSFRGMTMYSNPDALSYARGSDRAVRHHQSSRRGVQ